MSTAVRVMSARTYRSKLEIKVQVLRVTKEEKTLSSLISKVEVNLRQIREALKDLMDHGLLEEICKNEKRKTTGKGQRLLLDPKLLVRKYYVITKKGSIFLQKYDELMEMMS